MASFPEEAAHVRSDRRSGDRASMSCLHNALRGFGAPRPQNASGRAKAWQTKDFADIEVLNPMG
jgi:hypothetical protein